MSREFKTSLKQNKEYHPNSPRNKNVIITYITHIYTYNHIYTILYNHVLPSFFRSELHKITFQPCCGRGRSSTSVVGSCVSRCWRPPKLPGPWHNRPSWWRPCRSWKRRRSDADGMPILAGLGRSGGFWWTSCCRKWKSQYKSRPNMWEMGIWMDLDGFGGSSEGWPVGVITDIFHTANRIVKHIDKQLSQSCLKKTYTK